MSNYMMERYVMSNCKRKYIRWMMCVFLILLVIGWSVLYFHEIHIKKITIDNEEMLTDGFSYFLDEKNISDDGIISGWIVKDQTQIDTCEINVLLKACDSNEAFVLPTEVLERKDVTSAIDDGKKYDYSGFRVKVGNIYKYIDWNKNYILCFKLKINNITYYYNTKEFIAL